MIYRPTRLAFADRTMIAVSFLHVIPCLALLTVSRVARIAIRKFILAESAIHRFLSYFRFVKKIAQQALSAL